jgi:2-dehydro-3-deoxygluconokinase
MQYSDFIFGDQNEWEVATGVPHIHVDNMQADTQLDMDAYRRYFDEMHCQFPNCRSMILALRNEMTTNHHTLTGLLWLEGEIYLPRIYDIYPVLDPMGVGDAYVAAYIHAALKRPDDPQFQIDFALAASQLKNSISGDFNLVTEEEILEQMQEG